MGFPAYEVSDRGRVRRCLPCSGSRVGKLIAPRPHTKGYVTVGLYRDKRRTSRLIHSLVAEAFIGPRPPGHEVNHRDGDKLNNHAGNIEWVTSSANTRHADLMGLRPVRSNPQALVRLRRARQQGMTVAAAGGLIGVSERWAAKLLTRAA